MKFDQYWLAFEKDLEGESSFLQVIEVSANFSFETQVVTLLWQCFLI